MLSKRSAHRSHANEIFREARQVAGRLTTLVVYETWGDLLFEAYEPDSRNLYSLHASLADIVTVLATSQGDPLLPPRRAPESLPAGSAAADH